MNPPVRVKGPFQTNLMYLITLDDLTIDYEVNLDANLNKQVKGQIARQVNRTISRQVITLVLTHIIGSLREEMSTPVYVNNDFNSYLL